MEEFVENFYSFDFVGILVVSDEDDENIFYSCPILLDFFILFQTFCPGFPV